MTRSRLSRYKSPVIVAMCIVLQRLIEKFGVSETNIENKNSSVTYYNPSSLHTAAVRISSSNRVAKINFVVGSSDSSGLESKKTCGVIDGSNRWSNSNFSVIEMSVWNSGLIGGFSVLVFGRWILFWKQMREIVTVLMDGWMDSFTSTNLYSTHNRPIGDLDARDHHLFCINECRDFNPKKKQIKCSPGFELGNLNFYGNNQRVTFSDEILIQLCTTRKS